MESSTSEGAGDSAGDAKGLAGDAKGWEGEVKGRGEEGCEGKVVMDSSRLRVVRSSAVRCSSLSVDQMNSCKLEPSME